MLPSSHFGNDDGLPEQNSENYRRLLLSFKAMGSGIWDFDITHGTLYCDDVWHSILGISRQNARITSVSAFKKYIHLEDVAKATESQLEEIAHLIERDERYYSEFRIIRPDGHVRWIRSVACVETDHDGSPRAIGCITDITEFRAEDLRQVTIPPETNATPTEPSPPAPATEGSPLTYKERECLLWVSVGKTAWETAAILNRSQRTVEFHLGNAIRKLNASNKVHAAVIAIRKGLL